MPTNQPDGYLTLPKSGQGPGVLVLHAWWGLNSFFREVCDRLAAEGFVVFAPDLYHGKIAKTIPEAEVLSKAVESNYLQVEAEIADAAKFLAERVGQSGHGLGVVGFSLGAYFAVDLASTDSEHIRAVVLFYGTGDGDLTHSQASFLGHFAENDSYEPVESAQKMELVLQKLNRPTAFYIYPGVGHWFFEKDRQEGYNAEAADLAWQRTVKFLHDTLDE